jgi:hypothetical protein
MTATPTIEAQNLTKTYPGGAEAVKGIDLDDLFQGVRVRG